MRKNAYSGACKVCGEHVEAGAGALVGNPLQLNCIPCSGEVDVPLHIKVTRESTGEILFVPSAHLGDRFHEFVTAIREGGAAYDGRNNRAAPGKALGCIANLERANFLLQIHPDVSAMLQAFAHDRRKAVSLASERALKVDQALQTRGLALFGFQHTGVEWLASRDRALLADDMGLGKTIQALIAIPEHAPVLVVGPENGVGVWGDEAPKWRPDLTFGSVKKRGFHWPAPGEMVYITYESIPDEKTFDHLGQMHAGTVVIADEAHKIKNPKTLRTKRFREIAHRARLVGGHAWLLTGSPMLNRPLELWGLLQALDLGKEAFGTYWQFADDFHAYKDSWGKTIWGEAKPQVAEKLRKVMLRREKAQVLTDLPEKTYRVLPVPIGCEWDTELAKCLDQLTKHTPSVWDWLRAGTAAWEEGAPKPGQARPDPVVDAKEIKAAREALLDKDGYSFHDLSHALGLLAKAKIPAMINVIEDFEEAEEPVVVFSTHRAPIDSLAMREGWAVITGDVDGEQRQRIVRNFQDGKYKGIGLTIDAGGTALTLTRASQVVFVDRSFTPKFNEQAEDRLVRIGQTRGVVITTLVADHFLDQRIAKILDLKNRIIRSSITAASINGTARPAAPAGVAEVDFVALAKAAEASLNGVEEAKAEAERIATERAKNSAELRAKLAQESEERKIRENGQKRYEAARQRALARGWVEAADHPERRGPQTQTEEWAALGLVTLSGLDPDRATSRNDKGFSKADSYLGHWLTVEIVRGLTPNQWQLAITLCRPYWRQVGRCPTPASAKEEVSTNAL
jgi:hypothetical protein